MYDQQLQDNIYYAMNFSSFPFASLVANTTYYREKRWHVKEGTNRSDIFKAFPRNRNFALGRVHAEEIDGENLLSREEKCKQVKYSRDEKIIFKYFAIIFRESCKKFNYAL